MTDPYFKWQVDAMWHATERMPSMAEFLTFGIMRRPQPVLRFDHPGKKLAARLFSRRLLGEVRKV